MADRYLEGFSANNVLNQAASAVDPDNVAKNVVSGFQGFLSAKPAAKYMSGARTIIRINGRIAAFATEVSWKINSDGKEIWGIDNYLPQEIIPNRLTVTGTISGLVVPGSGPANNLITPDTLSFLFHKYITIEVRDSQTDSLLFYTGKATIVNQQDSIKAGQLANISLSFKAIAYRDEKQPEYPEGSQGSAANEPTSRSPGQRVVDKAKKWFDKVF